MHLPDQSSLLFEATNPLRECDAPHTPTTRTTLGRTERSVLGAVAGLFAGTLIVGFACAPQAAFELAGAASVSMLGVGKFLPIWGVTGQSQFSAWELGMLIWMMDTLSAVVVLYGQGALCRISVVKRSLTKVQLHAGLVLTAYPRVRSCAIAGVVLFVIFPVTGTGAVVGSFLGVLLGLDRRVVLTAVSAGGFLGGMVMATLATYCGDGLARLRAMQQHVGVKYAILAALLCAAVLAVYWLGRAYRRALARSHRGATASAPGIGVS